MNDYSDSTSSRLRRSFSSDEAAELPTEVVRGAADRKAPRLVNHGRATRAATLSFTAVAAVAVGSLVIANPFAPQPLFTAAGAGAGVTSAAASEAATSDMRIAQWINYEYVAGDGLSTSGGRGAVYALQRTGTPESVLSEVAERYGVDGAAGPTEYFDEQYPSYVIGAEDGSAPSVTISWVGTANWWFTNPDGFPQIISDDDTEFVEPSLDDSLAPGESEARSLAREAFAASGLEVAAEDIRITVDAYQTMANAYLTVDGVATALDWGIAWSAATGELVWAYGHAIEVVERGTFDTVSPVNAVDRLSDWRWFGAAGPDYQGGMNILAAESGVARDTAAIDPDAPVSSPVEPAPVEPTPGEPTPGEPTPGEPTPGEPAPLPEPETVTVTVDDAEATLLLLWDAQGNAWLVPGYAMLQPEGWWNAVVSLVEGVIALPEPIDLGTIDPGVIDPGVIEPGVVEPGVVEPGVVDPAPAD
jgi:cell division septation protein DedD